MNDSFRNDFGSNILRLTAEVRQSALSCSWLQPEFDVRLRRELSRTLSQMPALSDPELIPGHFSFFTLSA
ncbi:hypothetical protein [Desulfonema magnum]|uniref:Uncharacterized protein n=1 Tax=Desulfonema magnum TaxID=45655 RepID=A0A975BXH5_9BACT|nr:hypothetical protein [Desulfonema magnum]QTA92979.1 Uncharacterized protein dnm_090720 [Desulfonema magnum]